MLDKYKLDWNNKLEALKAMHKDIAVLCKDKTVAYLDIPLHFNVGDQLIYAGTEAFFLEHNINVKYRAFDENVDLKKVEVCDIILFHGGGNFGDIYPQHQRLRENVITKFPNKRIVILPQTIHFSNDNEKSKSSGVFNSHPDLHIFVRDTRSLEIAKEFTQNACLMPDMAHSLHPLVDVTEVESLTPSSLKILNLRRVDVEKVDVKLNLNKPSFDWVNILTPWDYIHHKVIVWLQKYKFTHSRLNNSWKIHSDSLVFRSVNYFSSFNTVYTDRLHGFILSYLLGKNIKLMDNSYGKNMGYYNQWIKEDSLIELMGNDK
ncbi:polysaccharide pyruvyl transferase family protein [Vibrio sp. NTOU-M3]|uniref:polysaccharide pyruvyl transferase family protein n=1 Tax=Vibrio sp. NTOU-M3 TaxID=3234954 RepID=UPI00349FAFE3